MLQEELDVVQNQGAELLTACGEPDKPVIKKSIDEVNSAWENLNKAWKERAERLEEAMQAAVQFQDGLQVCLLLLRAFSLIKYSLYGYKVKCTMTQGVRPSRWTHRLQ